MFISTKWCTLTGRQIVKHMSAEVNNCITGDYDHVGKAVIYGDTDSVYFSAWPILKDDVESGKLEWTPEKAITLYDQICEQANTTFPKFMADAFHCPKTRSDVPAARWRHLAMRADGEPRAGHRYQPASEPDSRT